MRSDSGALTPECRIAAAMEHRQYDNAVLLSQWDEDHAIGKAADQRTACAALSHGIGIWVRTDALEHQTKSPRIGDPAPFPGLLTSELRHD